MGLKAIFGVVPVALVAAVIGCGGGSSSSDDDGTASGAKSAGDSAKAQKLLDQTFGPNPAASSGLLSGTIDVDVKGVPRFRQPVGLSMSGPFRQSGSTPEANLTLGLKLRDTAIGGELILVGDEVLIGLGSTAYRIPDSISATIRRPLRRSDNALAAVLEVFGIAPQRWAKNPRIVGNERVAGVEVIHGTAQIDTARFFLDVARLTKLLTSLRITEITGLPRVIDRPARVALVRSVKSATGDVYTGAEDHVLRKAKFNMTLEPSAADRRRLGGISSLKLVGELNVSEVGSEQKVSAPSERGSYDALQITLDALADGVDRDARQGK